MPRKPKPQALVAKQSFSVQAPGRDRMVRKGDVLSPDDPIVVGRESMFIEVGGVVEQATAVPGERRSVPARS